MIEVVNTAGKITEEALWLTRFSLPVSITPDRAFMKLDINGLQDSSYIEAAIGLPDYDVVQMQDKTAKYPRWVHFGPGNIFRVLLARMADDALSAGEYWPITAVTTRDPQRVNRQLADYDLLTLRVILDPDGTEELRVISGIGQVLATTNPIDHAKLMTASKSPDMSLVSLTITEKGYVTRTSEGHYIPTVSEAIKIGPEVSSSHAIVTLTQMLLARFNAGEAKITILSFDNFSRNGDVLREAVIDVASGWQKAGYVELSFVEWCSEQKNCAFPLSVIDKITPQPNQEVEMKLRERGFDNLQINLDHGAPLAGFVNTEPVEYLVIEDRFVASRPPLEDYGAYLVDRETCIAFDEMKVTACLNPLHTVLAIIGCLLKYPTIDATVKDLAARDLAYRLGKDEGARVVTDPGIVDPIDFLNEVLDRRFANQYLPDSPHRIAMDTSQKMPIRFGQTLRRYRENEIATTQLRALPLAIALWLRYLLAVDDNGEPMDLSSDPRLEELRGYLSKVSLGMPFDAEEVLEPILSDPSLFGLSLLDTPVAERISDYFTELCSRPGAVRSVLDKEMSK